MQVLIDGRIDGADGIGRYTRAVVAGLRQHRSPEFELTVLEAGTARRYSHEDGAELVAAAVACRPDVVHALDCRVPVTAVAQFPTVVTVHDVMRVSHPALCYADADFAGRFGEDGLAGLRDVVDDLRQLARFPVRSAPVSLHEEFLGRMLVLAVERAEHVITPTTAVARQMCELISAGDKVRVSAWGIDHLPAATERLPAGVSGRFLLYVGQARPHKGLSALLAAVHRTAAYRQGVLLVLAGRDFAAGGVAARTAVSALGAGRVLPLGEITDVQLAGLYARADALVHLADHEGFGLPPLEAIAHGCPVVASDIAVLRETLGTHAEFVDPRCPDEVAERVDAAIAEDGPQARTQRVRWTRRFRWERHIEDLTQCYRQACSTRPCEISTIPARRSSSMIVRQRP